MINYSGSTEIGALVQEASAPPAAVGEMTRRDRESLEVGLPPQFLGPLLVIAGRYIYDPDKTPLVSYDDYLGVHNNDVSGAFARHLIWQETQIKELGAEDYVKEYGARFFVDENGSYSPLGKSLIDNAGQIVTNISCIIREMKHKEHYEYKNGMKHSLGNSVRKSANPFRMTGKKFAPSYLYVE